jgi:hypothetical protein
VTDDQRARAVAVGTAIQATVSRDPELSVSVIGMGLDALSSALIHTPDKLEEMRGWLQLIAQVEAYVYDPDAPGALDDGIGTLGVRYPLILQLIAGDLSFRALPA